MTRIEELKTMKGPQLIAEAEKLGIKLRTNKEKTKLVESKDTAIKKILKFDAMPKMTDDEFTPEQIKEMDEAIESMHSNDSESTKTKINENTQAESENATEINVDNQKHASEPKLIPIPGLEKMKDFYEGNDSSQEWSEKFRSQPKRGALIEYNGKAQNICAWAKELGISANTLYCRLYKLGWTVDKAFTKGGKK